MQRNYTVQKYFKTIAETILNPCARADPAAYFTSHAWIKFIKPETIKLGWKGSRKDIEQ